MNDRKQQIRDTILSETRHVVRCGIEIRLPDDLDGYFYWEGWHKDPKFNMFDQYRSDYLEALTDLEHDGHIVRLDDPIDLPDGSMDYEDNRAQFLAEARYIGRGQDWTNEGQLALLNRYLTLPLRDHNPGLVWFGSPAAWADAVGYAYSNVLKSFRNTNNWDALIVDVERLVDFAHRVKQEVHPRVPSDVESVLDRIAQIEVRGRNLSTRVRQTGEKPVPAGLWMLPSLLIAGMLVAVFFGLFEVGRIAGPYWQYVEQTEGLTYAQQLERCHDLSVSFTGVVIEDYRTACSEKLSVEETHWYVRPRLED